MRPKIETQIKFSVMKWFVMILIGSVAYLSGYFYGQKTNIHELQRRQTASEAPAVPVDSSH